MSVDNINPGNHLPDVDELQKLANQFFSALPGRITDIPLREENAPVKTFNPASQLPAGAGISPSSARPGSFLNTGDPQTSLPDPNVADINQEFRSPANGPSYSSLPGGIDHHLPDPNTASSGLGSKPAGYGLPYSSIPGTIDHHLPDPNAASSSLGSKPAGYGLPYSSIPGTIDHHLPDPNATSSSLGSKPAGYGLPYSSIPGTIDHHLPFAPELPFETELRAIINSLSTFSQPQLPSSADFSPERESFYFLDQKDRLPFLKNVRHPSGISEYGGKKNGEVPKFSFDFNQAKNDFPILQERVNGRQLIWLDNAATTQKPRQVIDRLSYFYAHENSNIHRAAHELAARATDAYEWARKKVQAFLHAASVNEIIFVRGATEAINLVAQSWGEQYLKEGDEIVISYLEHHANIVPWQILAAKKGLKLRVIPVDEDGQIILEEYAKILGPKTKLVSFTQVSNALGTVTPAKKMVEMAHAAGAKVLVDGAQSVSHMRADVTALNCDWFVFSGHKVFGPTGIGVLYGKENILNETQPWQGGGNMIADVTFEHTKYQDAPARFEAGTGNIADAVGLGAAIDYVNRIGIDVISSYEHYLLQYATRLLNNISGVRIIGTAPDKAGVLSFILKGYKTEEIGAALNKHGIAVRSGHHCAQPILRRFGQENTVRASLALYNTCSDIDALISVIQQLSNR